MPYAISESDGRYVVTSPKGKKWKTTYASRAAAEKGVAYVESRFGRAPSRILPETPSEKSPDAEDTVAERKALGIPPLGEKRGEF